MQLGQTVDVRAAVMPALDAAPHASAEDVGDVQAGDLLRRLVDALAESYAKGDSRAVSALHQDGVAALGGLGLTDALAVAAGFNAITRIADAIGIQVDPFMLERSGDVREEAGIDVLRERHLVL